MEGARKEKHSSSPLSTTVANAASVGAMLIAWKNTMMKRSGDGGFISSLRRGVEGKIQVSERSLGRVVVGGWGPTFPAKFEDLTKWRESGTQGED